MENKNSGKTTNRVAQLRKEHGLSQTELGNLIYTNQRTISYIEDGVCSLSNIVALADVFNVSIDYILNRSDNMRKETDLDNVDLLIMGQLNKFTASEKERLLKHLELDNSLKNKNGN